MASEIVSTSRLLCFGCAPAEAELAQEAEDLADLIRALLRMPVCADGPESSGGKRQKVFDSEDKAGKPSPDAGQVRVGCEAALEMANTTCFTCTITAVNNVCSR